MRLVLISVLLAVASIVAGCNGHKTIEKKQDIAQNKVSRVSLTDDELMDLVQRETFNYFWEGAEPISGLARERIHMDGIYPNHHKDIITIGGSGFGLMAIL
ncbi:MAG: beta-glucosidase, partial [Flavobacteriaceae bacterium]